MNCLDCGKSLPEEAETDIRLCQACMNNYNINRLWQLHDANELNALDFNEDPKMRDEFRIHSR